MFNRYEESPGYLALLCLGLSGLKMKIVKVLMSFLMLSVAVDMDIQVEIAVSCVSVF